MKSFGFIKYTAIAIAFALFLGGCDKFKTGTIKYKVEYTSLKNKEKRSEKDSIYPSNIFGAYITSITPRKLTARLNVLMYLDHWNQQEAHMISYVDGHDNDPNYQIYTDVNFTDNQIVEYKPILYSKDMRDGTFEQNEVTFTYFLLAPTNFMQEIELPSEYGDFRGAILDSITGKRIWTVAHYTLCDPIFGAQNRQPWGYMFGNTDTTYLQNQEKLNHPVSEEYPFGDKFMIRSHAYKPVTVKMPSSGEEIEMYSTVGFDSEDLVQIYEGNDGKPYTMDDVFVYAPNYWERLYTSLEVR